MKQLIIGTAGHIDHGKTALIKALTGFEGDTLEEEKRRGITIDLSFSHLKAGFDNIAFIDVPGHEKLVKTMIAGAFGFDAALLVVDSKEGLMPQSIEHLHVLDLLGLKQIVVALSKADLVDAETIKKQMISVKNFFKKNFTNLEIYDILPVSIYDKSLVENLKNTLFSLPNKEKIDRGIARYYIDRSFSLKGIGTVVTGTLLEGILKKNSKIFITELAKDSVMKNLQVHNEDVEVARQGERVAINLSDVDAPSLQRGFLLTQKGYVRGFNVADVKIVALKNKKISHNSNIIFHAGAKQVEARVLYYDSVSEEGFAKLEFKENMYLVFEEPFIITQNGVVVGGGKVLNAINDPLKKVVKKELLQALGDKDFRAAFKILINSHKKGFGLISSYQRFGLSHEAILEISKEIKNAIVDTKNMIVYPESSLSLVESMVEQIYTKNKYALLSSTSLSIKHPWISEALADAALQNLEKQKSIKKNGGVYQNASIKIDDINELVENKILEVLVNESIAPTAPYNIYDELDIDRKSGDEALKKLTSAKKVVRLSHNLFISSSALSSIMAKFREIIKTAGFIDINEAKKYFDLSRKYIIAYLDYLDNFEDIKKEADKRVFK
ncbi:MAG: selenocysteine-specific translation elongation factor [Campylobacteraceae bacterium]